MPTPGKYLYRKSAALFDFLSPVVGRRRTEGDLTRFVERIDHEATFESPPKGPQQPQLRSKSLDVNPSVEEHAAITPFTPSLFGTPGPPEAFYPSTDPDRTSGFTSGSLPTPQAVDVDDVGPKSDTVNHPHPLPQLAPAKVVPANDVSYHIMCYLFLPGMLPDIPEPGDPGYIPIRDRHKVLFPKELFVHMYEDFKRQRALDPACLSHDDLYTVFSVVVLEYGDNLNESHSNVDWLSCLSRLTLHSLKADDLAKIYLQHLAPLVAVWLTQVRLAFCCAEFGTESPSQSWDLTTGRHWDPAPLMKGLASISSTLGVAQSWDQFIDSHEPNVGIDSLSAWLHRVAADAVATQVLCELKGAPARLVLDVLDETLGAFDDTFMRHPFANLYISLVQNSLDMPSRFWTEPIWYYHRKHYLAGGVRVFPHIISGEPASILVTWTDGNQDCATMWDGHKAFLRALAVQSQCRHPNIISITSVFLDEHEFEPLRIICPTIPNLEEGYPFYHDLVNVSRLIIGLGEGLGYLHSQDIIHGDLQWPNVVVDSTCHIRLWNFDMRRSKHHETSVITGRPYWNHSRPFPRCKRSDIYSCGIMFLAAAMASPSHESTLPTYGIFNEVRSHLEEQQVRSVLKVQMPTQLAQLKQLTQQQGEGLWEVISDMTDLDLDIDMTNVNTRLRSFLCIQ